MAHVPTVVLDLDGVCADMSPHEHLLVRDEETGKIPNERWEEFWSKFPDADLLEDGLDLALAIESLGWRTAYSTTRPYLWKSASTRWLHDRGYPKNRSLLIRMKHQGRAPAKVIKLNHARVLTARLGGAPLLHVDDEQTAVDYLRAKNFMAVNKTNLPTSITALRTALDDLFAEATTAAATAQ